MATVSKIPAAPQVTKRSLSDIVKRSKKKLPLGLIICASGGFGKTSLGTCAKDPIFIQSKGERGLEALIDAGQVEETPFFPVCETYAEVVGSVLSLLEGGHTYKTVVFDTVNGVERLILDHVCDRDFSGNQESFQAYGRGIETALSEVVYYVSLLDRLRTEQDMTVMLLGHAKVKTVKNPGASDFDRYQLDAHDKTFAILERWADAVIFGGYNLLAVKETDITKKAKMAGGDERVLYCQPGAAFVAKNRLGLPAEIPGGSTYKEMFRNLASAIFAGRKTQDAAPAVTENKETE
jgi:hypothetical protein